MAVTSDPIAYALDQVREVAALPEITVRIIQIVEDPDSTARDLHEVVCNDPSLSSRLLRVVNSAFFGLPGQIGSIERAIVLLGLNAVKNIAIAASLGQLFRRGKLTEKHAVKELWTHSVGVAALSRVLTGKLALALTEEAFLAGLIHDLGLVIAAQAFHEQLAEVIRRGEAGEDFEQLELELIGCTHGQIGQAITAKWKFPRPLQYATGFHHHPEQLARENRLLTNIVHVADVVCNRRGVGLRLPTTQTEPAEGVLDALHLTAAAVQAASEDLEAHVRTVQDILGGN
jgi:HD-like signal output (HDOD) protein